MFYMDRLAKRQSMFDENFDPDMDRTIILQKLITYSEPIEEICLHCMKLKSQSNTNDDYK